MYPVTVSQESAVFTYSRVVALIRYQAGNDSPRLATPPNGKNTRVHRIRPGFFVVKIMNNQLRIWNLTSVLAV